MNGINGEVDTEHRHGTFAFAVERVRVMVCANPLITTQVHRTDFCSYFTPFL